MILGIALGDALQFLVFRLEKSAFYMQNTREKCSIMPLKKKIDYPCNLLTIKLILIFCFELLPKFMSVSSVT